jgi:outer membrane protein assembly factor BamB
MFRGDAARRGEGGEGPVGQPVLRWRFQAEGSVNPPPAVVAGIVYAISDDGVLHAIADADGKEVWSFPHALSGTVGPTVWQGSVYVTDKDGVIWAVDAATGTERWHSPAPITGGLTVADDRLVVSTNGAIVELDATTGTQRWRYSAAAAEAFHTPAYAAGVVYAGSDSGGFVALDGATGALRWHADTGNDATGTAVVADGIAYLAGSSNPATGHLRAFDAANGRPLWVVDQPFSSPAVSAGIAYSPSSVGLVSAHDATTGKELWRYSIRGTARPLGVAGGVVYVPADDEHRIYALDAKTGAELWHFDLDGGIDGSLAVAGGSVYVGTSLGGVYAIGGNGSSTTATLAPTAGPPSGPPTATVTPGGGASPTAGGPSPAKFLWSATGAADGMSFPNSMSLDSPGRVWVADTGHSRFAIFKPDGTFVEYWGAKGAGAGQFDLQRANGDGYGAIAFAPDGSFYVLDVGNLRVEHFDKSRHLLKAWGELGQGPGQFVDPIAIAVDAKGSVHVLDDARGVVETYDREGKVLGSFDPHLAGRNSANSMTLDAASNVYITACCSAGNQVRKYDPSGKQVATIGSPGNGPGQFSDQPGGIGVDAAGRVFVTQGTAGDGDRVLVFDARGHFLASFGSQGSGDGQMGFATGLLLDGKGNVYIADAGSAGNFGGRDRIEKFGLLRPFAAK